MCLQLSCYKLVFSLFFQLCNFSTAFLPANLPQYYNDYILITRADFFPQTPETSNDLLNETIWKNQDIHSGCTAHAHEATKKNKLAVKLGNL